MKIGNIEIEQKVKKEKVSVEDVDFLLLTGLKELKESINQLTRELRHG